MSVSRKPAELKGISGTDQPCYANVLAFDLPDGAPPLPEAFAELQAELPKVAERIEALWNSYLEIFARRGQSVADFGAALYSMCTLEVRIRTLEETGKDVPMAMVNGHRVYLHEFHLTPAGNVVPASSRKGNDFAKNGRPPRRA